MRRNLTSEPVELQVRPLPQGSKPIAFSGAVGDFSISSEIDKTEVIINDAINLTLKIRGQGNVKLVDPPTMQFPPDFEVYDPEINTNIRTSQAGVAGTKEFKYLIIPRVPGNYDIGPFSFAYFDIEEGRYKTHTTPKYQIKVNKGDAEASEGISVRSGSKKDIQYLGEDIRYIRTGDLNLRPTGAFFFRSSTFYLYLAIPLVLFILLMIVVKKVRSSKNNIALQKERKATRFARKRLKKSRTYADKGDTDAFYNELSEAIWGYLSYKFDISLANLSFEVVREKLSEKHVDEPIIEEFTDILEACEYARFAPGDKDKRMEEIYNRAKAVIIKTEKELK
ncbi:MAG: BatD family protein [Bacteroidales bacterium]|nr:BatD family protein [Bacteroidales bacterium]